MNFYSFADLTIAIENKYPYTEFRCKEYLLLEQNLPDITVSASDADLKREQSLTPQYDCGYLEFICIYRALCNQLPAFQAMVLHGCLLEVGTQGIVFLAPSGVGKTTHLCFWKQQLPSLRILNGDKPLVRCINDNLYGYGTPWAGKENYHENDKTLLTDLCFLRRGTQNTVRQLSPSECTEAMMRQIFIPAEAEMAEKTLELADILLRRCRLWEIVCTPHPDAARCAIQAIVKTNRRDTEESL